MPRMKILNSVEREVFDFPPIFNSVERKRCFDFPTPLQDMATSLRTASNQLVFLLSCGYFKATKRFYPVPTFHRRDLTYVADRIAVTLEGIDLTDYPKQTMSRHQAAILSFYGFRGSAQEKGNLRTLRSAVSSWTGVRMHSEGTLNLHHKAVGLPVLVLP